ncbi:uncharacterized protein LOC8278316 isoform X2 [Ricinus communis]|uniref:uncharacterized protein LOC8278316 isoform X2 n=1 Tax=Ricinus communis TaxID=3988 RepID=UPI000D68B141|nr:uncharacterized protein LOC8278316 isoform X2 [Ricinus communis]|eukprot:XP_025014222.1 uncharacterized protein LOC8278316 isoform X2 [Ricinus communis]
MEGGKETELQETGGNNCSFVWDDSTQLYFHASGFYHDPSAGWYFSSRDGLYYKFENGSYVLLEYSKVNVCESDSCPETASDNHVQEESSTQLCCNREENISSRPADLSDVYPCSGIVPVASTPECSPNQEAEIPPPPSEWLEETLINLYLSGYKQSVDDADVSKMSSDVDGASHDDTQMLEDGDWMSEHHPTLTSGCESISNEDQEVQLTSCLLADACKDEENWQAQYGQVVYSGEQPLEDFHAVDLWDWAMVTGSRKDGKDHTTRLVGRLVKRSAKLHPSMPSSGLFRTAPICEAHLDLVRVRTGLVYKLHTPSARYLASLSSYDSSNPTIDWGFPELSTNGQAISTTKFYGKREPKLADEDNEKGWSMLTNQLSRTKKQRIYEYRDRAAERRTLHGSFGVGPGEKSSLVEDVFGTSPVSTSTEEAAAKALNMSLGAGSYARKILENMGWKEGEALGKTRKGLIIPIQAVGNMGSAGLGWSQGRMSK